MARWAVVTFGRGIEPDAAMRAVVGQLQARGVALAGFRQHRGSDLHSHHLVRLGAEGRAWLGTKGAPADPAHSCAFGFQDAGFEAGLAWLKADAPAADVLFVSLISKRELDGEGHAAALSWALGLPTDQVVVLCTAAERLEPVLDHFRLPGDPVAYLECAAGSDGVADFAAQVARAAGRGDFTHE